MPVPTQSPRSKRIMAVVLDVIFCRNLFSICRNVEIRNMSSRSGSIKPKRQNLSHIRMMPNSQTVANSLSLTRRIFRCSSADGRWYALSASSPVSSSVCSKWSVVAILDLALCYEATDNVDGINGIGIFASSLICPLIVSLSRHQYIHEKVQCQLEWAYFRLSAFTASERRSNRDAQWICWRFNLLNRES